MVKMLRKFIQSIEPGKSPSEKETWYNLVLTIILLPLPPQTGTPLQKAKFAIVVLGGVIVAIIAIAAIVIIVNYINFH